MHPDKISSINLRIPLWAATLFCAAAVPAVLAAHHGPHDARFPIAIAEVEAKTTSRFAAIDTDQSGSVDLAEFEAAPSPMRGERGPGGMGKHARKRAHAAGMTEGPRRDRWEALRAAVEAEMFALLDADGDGAVTEAEFAAGKTRENRHLARKRAMFKQLDADNDNLLTLEEFPNPAARLREADTDGDGLVSKDEMRALRQARRAQQAG